MPDLKQLVRNQINHLEKLQVQLENELHLISSRDPESLTRLVEEKAENLDEIAALDKQIRTVYDSVEDSTLKEELKPLFKQAEKLVEQCKYRTQINEKAVEQGQLRLAHLRNLLLEVRAKESMTYDKTGKPRGGKSGKSIEA